MVERWQWELIEPDIPTALFGFVGFEPNAVVPFGLDEWHENRDRVRGA